MWTKPEFKRLLRKELETHLTVDQKIVSDLFSGPRNWPLLRFMALQGYQLTKHFLDYVEALFFYCPRGIHKRRLLINLYEEETGRLSRTDNHVVLMQKFLRAIGVTDEQRDAATALPATHELIQYRLELVKRPETFHLGAAAVLVASEGQNLELKEGRPRHEILRDHFGLTDKDVLFFSVHQKEDVGHVQQGIDVVADFCRDEREQKEALVTVAKTCELFRNMYAGMASEWSKLDGQSAQLAANS